MNEHEELRSRKITRLKVRNNNLIDLAYMPLFMMLYDFFFDSLFVNNVKFSAFI